MFSAVYLLLNPWRSQGQLDHRTGDLSTLVRGLQKSPVQPIPRYLHHSAGHPAAQSSHGRARQSAVSLKANTLPLYAHRPSLCTPNGNDTLRINPSFILPSVCVCLTVCTPVPEAGLPLWGKSSHNLPMAPFSRQQQSWKALKSHPSSTILAGKQRPRALAPRLPSPNILCCPATPGLSWASSSSGI